MKDTVDPAPSVNLEEIIVCPQCDAVYHLKVPKVGEKAVCERCHTVLIEPRKKAGLKIIAIAIATCLGLAKGLERLGDSISAKLILKKFEVTFCILSILITLFAL